MEFDTTGIFRNIRQRFVELNADSPLQSFIQLITIRTDTSASMKNRFNLTSRLKSRLDSLDNNYNRVKERRKFVFQKPADTSREQELKATYNELLQIREARDLAELEYRRMNLETDSLWRIESIRHADDLLRSSRMEGYLLIDQINFS